jgi:protein SCO1
MQLFAVAWLVCAAPARAPVQGPPGLADAVGIEQRLGAEVPLDLELVAQDGRTVRLGDALGGKPAVLALVYYACPMLCTLVLNGTLRAVNAMRLELGSDYRVLAVTIDPAETPELAAAKQRAYLPRLLRSAPPDAWPFFTGQAGPLAESVGFRYAFDPKSGQYAHAGGLVVLTPEGRVSRYLYGVEYSARDLQLALIEAADGRIGGLAAQLLALCYAWDPAAGRYTMAALTAVRGGGVLTVLSLGACIGWWLRRERRSV